MGSAINTAKRILKEPIPTNLKTELEELIADCFLELPEDGRYWLQLREILRQHLPVGAPLDDWQKTILQIWAEEIHKHHDTPPAHD